MTIHKPCGTTWTGLRLEHCAASGVREFALRPAESGTHLDPGSLQRSIDRSWVEAEELTDPLGADATLVQPCRGHDVDTATTPGMHLLMCDGRQHYQVGGVVVDGVTVDVVDVRARLSSGDDPVLIGIHVALSSAPAQPDVSLAADVAQGFTWRWFLVRPKRTGGQMIRAKALTAAGITSSPLTGRTRNLGSAVNADQHILILQWFCCQTFSGPSVGDAHRVGKGANRRCLTPDEMRAKDWHQNERGVWRGAPPREEAA